MEASLLPSKKMKALCAKVPVVAIGRKDPTSKRFMEEFGVPYVSSWVVVLNNKGEGHSWSGKFSMMLSIESAAIPWPFGGIS